MLFRLILFVAIISGLAIFTLSNMQPLTLTFLGFVTPSLPLSFWILGAIAAGMLTHVVISSLLHLTTYATARSVRTQLRPPQERRGFSFGRREQASAASNVSKAATAAASDDSLWRDWGGYEQVSRKQQPEPVDRPPSTSSSFFRSGDDWETPPSDDWESRSSDFQSGSSSRGPYSRDQPGSRPDSDISRNRTNFERPQEPKQASQSGSVYSYSYREPAVEPTPPKQETVVDADYRVIIPPYNPPESSGYTPPPPPLEEENADDWFEDDSSGSKPS